MPTIRYSQYFDVDSNMQIAYFTGNDLSGASGATNRVLTLSNTQLTTREQIFYNGLNLHSSLYTISRSISGTTITFIRPVWGEDRPDLIVVTYWLT